MRIPSLTHPVFQSMGCGWAGADLVPPDERSSEYLQKYFESEIAKWGKAIKATGIGLD
jgi:hypothetical protein